MDKNKKRNHPTSLPCPLVLRLLHPRLTSDLPDNTHKSPDDTHNSPDDTHNLVLRSAVPSGSKRTPLLSQQ